MKDKLTSIVIVHYTQEMGLEILKLEIDSILEFSKPEPIEILLVDNTDPDDEDAEVLALFCEQRGNVIRRIENDENLGWIHGCNQGIDEANGEFIVLMNNDVIVSLKWLTMLKNAWEFGIRSGYRVATVGPQAVFADHMQDLRDHPMFPNPITSPSMTHFCALFHKDFFQNVGNLDPLFAKVDGYFSDDDLNLRIAQAGYTNLIAPVPVLHLKPHFHRGEYASRCKEIFERTGPALFLEKWGSVGDYWLRNRQLPGMSGAANRAHNTAGLGRP